MFFKTEPANPWIEVPVKPAKAAVIPLLEIARFADGNRAFCKSNGFTTLADDARMLASFLQDDREVFTRHARLFIIRVPELQVALETMLKLPDDADSDLLKQNIHFATSELATLAKSLSENKHSRAISQSVIGLEVSRQAELPPFPADQGPDKKEKRLFGRVNLGGLTSVIRVAEKVSTTSVAYASLATIVGKNTIVDGVDGVTMPIKARAKALHSAIEEGVSIAIVGSLLVTVLFPPALPLAIGLAYLAAGDRHHSALDRTLSQQEQERKLRESGASKEVAKALAKVRGQRVIRLETEHLMAEVDLATNQIDGTILSGRYSGSRLSELDVETLQLLHKTTPDQDTGKLLIQYLDSRQS